MSSNGLPLDAGVLRRHDLPLAISLDPCVGKKVIVVRAITLITAARQGSLKGHWCNGELTTNKQGGP
jgi:hypothetical protein